MLPAGEGEEAGADEAKDDDKEERSRRSIHEPSKLDIQHSKVEVGYS
jgi:hypothetical protein